MNTRQWTSEEDEALMWAMNCRADMLSRQHSLSKGSCVERFLELSAAPPSAPETAPEVAPKPAKKKRGPPETWVKWTYDDDTFLRNASKCFDTKVAYYRTHLPHRSVTDCEWRYAHTIKPLLGLCPNGKSKNRYTTKLESHIQLARSDEEEANLRAYYNS